jgi:hypothetical protein
MFPSSGGKGISMDILLPMTLAERAADPRTWSSVHA